MCRRLTWLLVLGIALPLAAQTRTTTKVVVKLVGDCGSVPSLSMVLRGDELRMLKLEFTGKVWTTDSDNSFDAAAVTAIASLRFHPGRTACLRALPEQEDESGNPIARFVFNCAQGDYRRIAVNLGESVPVAYRRDVAKSKTATDSVACIETGAFEYGKGTVTDVETNREKVFIYPGFATADSGWDGILVSDLPATAGPVIRKLSSAELSDLFGRQVARGVGSAPPVLSANWRLRVRITLEKRGVNDVSISVQR